MNARTRPVIVGALSFAVVFALIVGTAVAIVWVRGTSTRSTGGGTAESIRVGTTVPSTDGSASSGEGSASPTESAAFCWRNTQARTVTVNPGGKLRSGTLEVTVPEGWEGTSNSVLSFVDDTDAIVAPVEETWVSMVGIAQVRWQTGYEYPGSEAAAQRLLDCTVANTPIWEPKTTKRHVEDATIAPVEIDGVTGHKATATIVFDKTTLTKTDGTYLTVIVLDGSEGPVVYYSDIARGVTAHEEAGAEVESSIAVS